MKFTIFVERIFDPETFKELKDFIIKKGADNCNLYCITPANYTLAYAEQGYQGSKDEFSKILIKSYKELQDMGCKIQLHLHLSLRPEKMNQEQLFFMATQWMRENEFECNKVAYGWYFSSDQSRTLEKKYNLSWEKCKWTWNIHDYEIHGNIYGIMMILQNVRNCFR